MLLTATRLFNDRTAGYRTCVRNLHCGSNLALNVLRSSSVALSTEPILPRPPPQRIWFDFIPFPASLHFKELRLLHYKLSQDSFREFGLISGGLKTNVQNVTNICCKLKRQEGAEQCGLPSGTSADSNLLTTFTVKSSSDHDVGSPLRFVLSTQTRRREDSLDLQTQREDAGTDGVFGKVQKKLLGFNEINTKQKEHRQTQKKKAGQTFCVREEHIQTPVFDTFYLIKQCLERFYCDMTT